MYMDSIFIIGIFSSLFFFVLLKSKKNKSLADSILAVWMLVIAIHLGNFFIYSKGFWITYPHLIGITLPTPFFYGPLLYLYIQYSLHDYAEFRKNDFWHFAPVVATYLSMIPFYFFYTVEEKRLVDSGELDDFKWHGIILFIGFVASGTSYAIQSYKKLNQYQKLIDTNLSNSEDVDLNWLKSFIIGVGAIFLSAIVVSVLKDVFEVDFPFNADYILYIIIVIGILTLGYFGIRHKNIFTDNLIVKPEESQKTSYQKSSLKEDTASELHDSLKQMMQTEKPYLESKLTLTMLANLLDTSPNHLSQVINQYEEQNFNDFVNAYRVNEFIERAKKDPHFSFLALAMESGFSSKSTFNAVFKKQKGTTPSEFMAKLAD